MTLAAGDEVTCAYTNTKRVDIDLLKYANGLPSGGWTFTLNGDGGSGPYNDVSDVSGVVDFGYPNPPGDMWLPAAETYTICETDIPQSTTAYWSVGGVSIDFVGGTNDLTGDGLMQVYNPDDDGSASSEDLGNRCVNVKLDPGTSIQFVVDNRTPLGDARTPGYWKGWSSCSNGNQFDKAAAEYELDSNAVLEFRHWTLDEALTRAFTSGRVESPHVYDLGVYIGLIELDGDSSGNPYDGSDANCEDALLVLSSSDHGATRGGKNGDKNAINRSGDPAYKLGRYLLAFIANQAAGAYYCPLAIDAALASQQLLADIGFDGTGEFLTKKGIQSGPGTAEDAANAMYYHGILGQYVENDPSLNCESALNPPYPAP